MPANGTSLWILKVRFAVWALARILTLAFLLVWGLVSPLVMLQRFLDWLDSRHRKKD